MRFHQENRTLIEQVEELEKKLIYDALSNANGNQSLAGRMLGLTERNLRYKMQKYDKNLIVSLRNGGDLTT